MAEQAGHDRADGVDGFVFSDPYRSGWMAWMRYKLKECWYLVLLLAALRRGQGADVVIHNAILSGKERVTDGFVLTHAPALGLAAPDRVGLSRDALLRGMAPLGLVVAALLTLLPLGAVQAFAGLALRRRVPGLRQVVVYCDSHLSGYLLCRAFEAHGVATASLQHALYRADDPGSMMNVRNRAARRIHLWDKVTETELTAAGHPPGRLNRIGAYGFGHLSGEAPTAPDLVAFCPPYDARWLMLFRDLADLLPDKAEHFFSLHPLLAAQHPDITARPVASADPRPGVAVCGDSGVIMDCLARGIPVLSIAARPLAGTHLTQDEARLLDRPELARLLDRARASLAADRAAFGFASGTAMRDDGPALAQVCKRST